jgi:hypothetical protein
VYACKEDENILYTLENNTQRVSLHLVFIASIIRLKTYLRSSNIHKKTQTEDYCKIFQRKWCINCGVGISNVLKCTYDIYWGIHDISYFMWYLWYYVVLEDTCNPSPHFVF